MHTRTYSHTHALTHTHTHPHTQTHAHPHPHTSNLCITNTLWLNIITVMIHIINYTCRPGIGDVAIIFAIPTNISPLGGVGLRWAVTHRFTELIETFNQIFFHIMIGICLVASRPRIDCGHDSCLLIYKIRWPNINKIGHTRRRIKILNSFRTISTVCICQ